MVGGESARRGGAGGGRNITMVRSDFGEPAPQKNNLGASPLNFLNLTAATTDNHTSSVATASAREVAVEEAARRHGSTA